EEMSNRSMVWNPRSSTARDFDDDSATILCAVTTIRLRLCALSIPERRERTPIDLAVRVARNRVDQHDGGGHLEGGELVTAVLEERRLGRPPADPDDDEAHRDLTIYIVGHADGRGVGHVRVLGPAIGELQRRDVDAALDDDVLLASRDVDVAVRIAPGEITVAEAVLGNRHQAVRALPVRGGELTAADHHLALLAGWHLATCVVENAHAHV